MPVIGFEGSTPQLAKHLIRSSQDNRAPRDEEVSGGQSRLKQKMPTGQPILTSLVLNDGRALQMNIQSPCLAAQASPGDILDVSGRFTG